MRRCLYCYELKDESKFSKEHVIPQSIGGNFDDSKSPFLLYNVCERCNNVLGVFVDSPFTKSILINMYRHDVGYKWVNPEKNKSIPLAYMGYNKQVNFRDNICEVYIGPTGDTIYHFHKQYPGEEIMTGVVGIPTTAKNKKPDKGFVFLFLASNNPIWIPTIFLSVINTFKGATHYLGNGPAPNIEAGNFQDIPHELQELHDELWEIQNSHHEQSFSHDLNGEQRFMAKLGLSIGAAFLKDSFIDSQDAQLLRSFMREKDAEKRKKIPIRGSGMLGGNWNNIKKLITWEYGHVLLLKPINDDIVLFVNYYGQLNNLIKISSDNSHWKGKINDDGILYVLVPEKQKLVGPMSLFDFLMHKKKAKLNVELVELENEIINYTPPPFIIDEGGLS